MDVLGDEHDNVATILLNRAVMLKREVRIRKLLFSAVFSNNRYIGALASVDDF